MKKQSMVIEMEFLEPLLGMASANPEVHREFIAARAEVLSDGDEEVAALSKRKRSEAVEGNGAQADPEEEFSKQLTVFPRDENGLFMWNYQLRGFIKEHVRSLIELAEPCIKGLNPWNYKTAINRFVRVAPRRIYLYDQLGRIWSEAPRILQRSLRADTPRGERQCLASSETLPPGTTLRFMVTMITGEKKEAKLAIFTEEVVEAIMNYGQEEGFGQWRNAGYGQFTWRSVEHLHPIPMRKIESIKRADFEHSGAWGDGAVLTGLEQKRTGAATI